MSGFLGNFLPLTGGTLTTSGTSGSRGVLTLQAANSAPANSDEVYESFKLSNSVGTLFEFVRQAAQVENVTSGAETGQIRWSIAVAGTLTAKLILASSLFSPLADDGLPLGSGALGWSDLFLSSGGVINWNNGNYTLTHSAGLLTFSGAAAHAGNIVQTATSTMNYGGLTTGLVNVMAATCSPAITAYTTGCFYIAMANLANTTTTPTINFNGVGAKTIVKRAATALAAGDYLANMMCLFVYDGTNMELLNPVVN